MCIESSILKRCATLQVTVVVLNSLLKRAFDGSGAEMAFEDWVMERAEESPTFKYWLRVLKYQQLIFLFIRAHRER